MEINNNRKKVLLLMTTGLSLHTWQEIGQLSRELTIYSQLADTYGHVCIYSYGRNEDDFVKDYPNLSVVSRLWFIPQAKGWPQPLRTLLDFFHNFCCLFLRFSLFSSVDIIKTNQFTGGVWGLLLKKIFRKPLVVRMGYYHGHFRPLTARQQLEQSLVFKRANRIMVSTRVARDFITEHFNLPAKRTVIQFNSMNTELFKPTETPVSCDLLFIGRLHNEKNIRNLLEAIRGLGLRIRIVGKGELKCFIGKFAVEHNEQIELIERVENSALPKIYNATKLFILPSLYEGNPKTLLEAMACGCAVIGTNVEGINNVIAHGETGWLCDTNTVSIQNCIETALQDATIRKARGNAAREFIEQEYALAHLIKKEISLFNAIEP